MTKDIRAKTLVLLGFRSSSQEKRSGRTHCSRSRQNQRRHPLDPVESDSDPDRRSRYRSSDKSKHRRSHSRSSSSGSDRRRRHRKQRDRNNDTSQRHHRRQSSASSSHSSTRSKSRERKRRSPVRHARLVHHRETTHWLFFVDSRLKKARLNRPVLLSCTTFR